MPGSCGVLLRKARSSHGAATGRGAGQKVFTLQRLAAQTEGEGRIGAAQAVVTVGELRRGIERIRLRGNAGQATLLESVPGISAGNRCR